MADERNANSGKAIHVSNPPGYNKIFTISAAGSTGITAGDIIPRHRALLITNIATSSGTYSVTVTNSDRTTSVLTIAPSTTLTIPIQIISYASANANLFIYGLL